MYQKILEELEDLIMIIDQENNIIYSNRPKETFENLIPVNNNFYKGMNNKIYSSFKKNIRIGEKEYRLYQYKENTKLYQSINNQQIDSITDIPNRTMVNQYLSKMSLNSTNSILAMIDIDKFKEINDTYGHLYGDGILSEIASVLKMQIRNTDFIGRYGGEEFIVILNSEMLPSALLRFDDIRNKVAEHFQNSMYKITISIGVTSFKQGDSIMEVVEQADKALYYVKENGRNNIGFFDTVDNQFKLLKNSQTKLR